MNKIPSAVTVFIFLTISFFISGCAKQRPETDPAMDKKARDMILSAKAANGHITSTKGIGWAKIQTPQETFNYRIAWIARFPDKIRITLLVMGTPVETIVATGEKVTFVSPSGEHAPHHVYEKNPSLERYIELPVNMGDIIALLSGRVPVKSFKHAYFSPQDPNQRTIVLHQQRNGPVQEFVFSAQQIKAWTVTDIVGDPIYKVSISEYSTVDGQTQFPSRIMITDTQGRMMELTLSRFIVNPEIKANAFVLTEE